ncbi:MAG: hypothetical protein ACK4UJ_08665 [Leptonema sp. (in: bacteria)]
MFVSFGTGFHQLPLLNALKNLGIPIIGIDQNPESVGKNLCDVFFSCSLLDTTRIIEFLKPYKKELKGIYSRSYGKVLEVANEVANYFDLPANPKESFERFRSKKEILEIALSHSFLKSQKEWIQNLDKAEKWVVKPISSFGKRDIQLITNKEYLKTQTSNLIEPYYKGKEYIFFGLIIHKQLYPLIITQKEIIDLETITNHKELAELLFCDKKHFFPSDLTEIQKYKIFQISNFIVKKTNLIIGPFLAEFIVDGENVFFLEAVPEVGGEFIADYLIPEILQLPYFELLVQIYRNQNLKEIKELLNFKLEQKKEKSFLINYILQKNGVFINLEFPESLWKSKYYYFHHLLKEKGSYTDYKRKNLDRLSVFGLAGNSLKNLIDLSNAVEKETKILYQ